MNDYQRSKEASRASWLEAMSHPEKGVKLPPWLAKNVWAIGCAALLTTILGLVCTWLLRHDDYRMTAYLLTIVGFSTTGAFIIFGWFVDQRMRRDFEEMKRRHQDMFGRAGIAIWQEDWSAVAEAIESLRAKGIHEIVGWYADHPEEARNLHARVQVTDVNWHACYLMRAKNPSELIGSLSDVVPGSFLSFQRWLSFFCSGDSFYTGENRLRRLDGEYFDGYITAAMPVDLEGYRQIMVSVIDISKYKRDSQKLAEAKEGLARVQSIITAGTLAATIAHEINSTLAAVATNSSACVRWLDRDPPVIHEANTAARAALDAIERAQTVVSNTKSYFTRVKSAQVMTDLDKVIRNTVALIENEAIRHDVQLTVSLDSDLSLQCDPIQIQQVLVNLCNNAIQAMKHSSKEHQLQIRAIHEEHGIAIFVEDNGPGIKAELLDTIFEPFYTTKEDGMGMGLAISRSCIENHGGWIEVNSVPDEGTLFKLILPKRSKSHQCKN